MRSLLVVALLLSGCMPQPIVQRTATAPLENAMQQYGYVNQNLNNINGAVMTVSQGSANINGVVNPANQFGNTVGSGLMNLLRVQGALGSLPNMVGGLFPAGTLPH